MYEDSLNRGVTHLNNETTLLADNPLIQEISLVVANQLLRKNKEDPQGLSALLTQEQQNQLGVLQNQMQRMTFEQQQDTERE
mmetsp:Transcript_19222/g.29468  ORF Transcript_19222/g.29468 Transcript_19222/m.29468 type:complete len:82 (-) Transcript_19222:15-260(-)